MKKPPCKDCTDRAVGCHAVCERYLEWAEMARSIRRKAKHDLFMDVKINDVLKRDALIQRGGRK